MLSSKFGGTVDQRIELEKLKKAFNDLQEQNFGTTFDDLAKEGSVLEKQLALIVKHIEGFKKESGGKPVPTEETDPVAEDLARLEFEMRESLLVVRQMFADREIETQEDLNKSLAKMQLIYLNQMLENTNLTEEQKLAIKERIALAEIGLIKEVMKAEKDKQTAAEKNIATMKETGKLMMQIGELEGENSKIRAAGIKITQAAAVAEGILGLQEAFRAPAKQATSGDPFSAFARVAAMAAMMVSVISNLKGLIGMGGGGGLRSLLGATSGAQAGEQVSNFNLGLAQQGFQQAGQFASMGLQQAMANQAAQNAAKQYALTSSYNQAAANKAARGQFFGNVVGLASAYLPGTKNITDPKV